MTACYIHGVSVFGSGLAGWEAAKPVLRGEMPWAAGAVAPPPASLLPPNERRRAGLATRIALAACGEAVGMAGANAADLGCVFASSNGEGAVVHGLLSALAGPDRLVSPTQFHNSVHNAVAGYWSIGTGSMQPVTCLACHDWTFATALVQAVASVAAGARDILLCVYDVPIPLPLGAARPSDAAFACALVLSANPGRNALARLVVEPAWDAASVQDAPRQDALQAVVAGNAAARSLRLLESLACGIADQFAVGLRHGRAEIAFAPC